MKDIKEWWIESGAKNLNAKAIELVGQKIGFIPIENLIDEEFSSEELKELIPLLTNDGVEVREIVGQNKLLINIK